jgi:uncharacterized protein with ParB-like and HNH nuclease domain
MNENNENSELIETSEDAEDEGESELYPYDPTQSDSDIDIREVYLSVFELVRRHNEGRLIVDPEFQRNPLVWKQEQRSQFIESTILDFPLPPFYVNETRDGKYIIVDGLQRTTALHQFVNNKFSLQGLEALQHLNGKFFDDLKKMSGAYQTKIEDRRLTLHVLRPSVPTEIIYDIFKRINTGGTQLNRQEMRNCIFIGKATRLLNELAKSELFKKVIDNSISSDRMRDKEFVLRYLSFQLLDYDKNYEGHISPFVEKAMRKMNKMSDEEIDQLKANFYRVMQLTDDFFGNRNFRVPLEGKTTRGRINVAVLESVGYFFAKQSDEFLQHHKPTIVGNFGRLLKDEEFLISVQKNTNGKNRVKTRFELAQQILGDITHADPN